MKRGRSGEMARVDWSIQVDNSSDVITKIDSLFANQFLTDVCLTVGSNQYNAHRLMLCAWSPVFETMFSPRWMTVPQSEIMLTESPACEREFKSFLEYFYTCKIEIGVMNVLPVLQLADKYGVEDLSTACTQYMEQHISLSTANNVFISWLQYIEPAGHKHLTLFCKQFALWNVSLLVECQDLYQLDQDVLIDLLQQNNLVIESEFCLFKFVVTWLNLHFTAIGDDDEDKKLADERLVMSVMKHIRFPMMQPSDIDILQTLPIISDYKEYFMWRLGVSMAYQSGQQVQAARLMRMMSGPQGHLIFTPRLYTADLFSFSLEINNVMELPRFVSRTYCFSSRTKLSAELCCKEEAMTDWTIDIFPRGVFFNKFFIIVWQGLLECPEQDKRTVRLRLQCQGPQFPLDVKVAICIFRSTNNVEYVCNVVEKRMCFDEVTKIINIDDLIAFDELSMAMVRREVATFKITLIIMPLDKYCSTVSPPTQAISMETLWRNQA